MVDYFFKAAILEHRVLLQGPLTFELSISRTDPLNAANRLTTFACLRLTEFTFLRCIVQRIVKPPQPSSYSAISQGLTDPWTGRMSGGGFYGRKPGPRRRRFS